MGLKELGCVKQYIVFLKFPASVSQEIPFASTLSTTPLTLRRVYGP
jgi:hypothetical protein